MVGHITYIPGIHVISMPDLIIFMLIARSVFRILYRIYIKAIRWLWRWW